MQFLLDVLDYSVDTEFSGIFGHVGVGRYLDEVHFGDGDVASGADCAVWSETHSELLVEEDGSF